MEHIQNNVKDYFDVAENWLGAGKAPRDPLSPSDSSPGKAGGSVCCETARDDLSCLR
jgi:hypothetical protein